MKKDPFEMFLSTQKYNHEILVKRKELEEKMQDAILHDRFNTFEKLESEMKNLRFKQYE